MEIKSICEYALKDYRDLAKKHKNIKYEDLLLRLQCMYNVCPKIDRDYDVNVQCGSFRFDVRKDGTVVNLYWNYDNVMNMNFNELVSEYIKNGMNKKGTFQYKRRY